MGMPLPPTGMFAATPAAGRNPAAAEPTASSPMSAPWASEKEFSRFIRYTSPTPPPSKREFYWEQIKANYSGSKTRGGERYREHLRRDKKARLRLLLTGTLAGLGFTAFRRLRLTFSCLLMLSLISRPIKAANKTFPRLELAYEQTRQGNPSHGRETFRRAMDESMLSIFHDFFKPLTYGLILSTLLAIPLGIRTNGDSALYRIFREAARLLRIKPEHPPIKWLNAIAEPLTTWGDRFSNKVRDKIPLIHWFEHT